MRWAWLWVWVLAGCTITREYQGGELGLIELTRLRRAQTKAEVLTQVGPPDEVGLQLEGSVFIYRVRREDYENLNLNVFQATFDYEETDRRTDRMVVFFDKDGNKTGFGLDLAD